MMRKQIRHMAQANSAPIHRHHAPSPARNPGANLGTFAACHICSTAASALLMARWTRRIAIGPRRADPESSESGKLRKAPESSGKLRNAQESAG